MTHLGHETPAWVLIVKINIPGNVSVVLVGTIDIDRHTYKQTDENTSIVETWKHDESCL